MKNLLLDRTGWREQLAHAPLALFLDYDGTLSAIAPTPQEAILSFQTRKVLEALIKCPGIKIAIVSGRSLGILQEMVRMPGLSYVGSHGAEFSSPGIRPKNLPQKYYLTLEGLKKNLIPCLHGMRGVLFEHKPVSFTIHYRGSTAAVQRKVRRLVLDICADPARKGRIAVIHGKKVIEIMPPGPLNKGQAVELLWRKWGKRKFFPVFIGDDRTDETAFAALGGKGLTVKVGLSKALSKAEYRLNSVDAVRRFLKAILDLRSMRL